MTKLANPNSNGNSDYPVDGELLPPASKCSGHLERLRGALTAGYSLAGTVGARRVQLQMLDGLTALKALS